MSLTTRLETRLASMPVIEQAKGVLMAGHGCNADQAFDLLCRAAQRSNLPVRELAEQIVKKAQQRRGQPDPSARSLGSTTHMPSPA